ncbi:hypothetical protein BC826DRAFT_977667 [Russula brevipes]|nr:hypothetical protein BC826DRAFT_977667 [Russula brevipes]
MICPMSGSTSCEKRLLTFTILDAVTFCKRKYAHVRDSREIHSSAALLPTWVIHVVIPFAESVGGAGLKKTWVPQKYVNAAPHTRQRDTPSCAICRVSLSVDTPMIPNFAVDSAVEKHVQALCINGIEGWETAGSKFTEWQTRKACVSKEIDQFASPSLTRAWLKPQEMEGRLHKVNDQKN